jgi:hypothetical protein
MRKMSRFVAAALALGAEPMLNTPAQFGDWMKRAAAKQAHLDGPVAP